jgi:phosphate transport system substrate-binding protein
MRPEFKSKLGWLVLCGLFYLGLPGCDHNRLTLQGSGATFPAPLYMRWFQEYHRLHPDIQVNYQATGSGAGEKQFLDGLVTFGATDAGFSKDDFEKHEHELYLLPLTAGSIVLAYNIPGVGDGLKLSREVYVDIFLGEITSWSDERIARLNPDVTLPNKRITVVRRAESSGTTFVFTQHLSAISPDKWGKKGKGPGANKSILWPTGVGGRNNSGVAALVKQTPGAIGYLEYQYAKASHLPTAALENKAGKYLQATPETSAATLASVKIPDNFRVWIADPKGADCYPIVTYTWIIVHRDYPDAEVAETLKSVLLYCLDEGQKISEELGYVPLPTEVAKKVRARVEEIKP